MEQDLFIKAKQKREGSETPNSRVREWGYSARTAPLGEVVGFMEDLAQKVDRRGMRAILWPI